MIVTIIADVLGDENNGTTTACMNLVRYLKKQGDEVRIVCSDIDKRNLEGYYIVDKINFGPLNKIVERNNVSLAKIDKDILEEAIKGSDIVHIMLPFLLSIAAINIANSLNIPVTAGFHCQAENVTSHLGLMDNRLANKATYKLFYKLLYKKVQAIHYPTEFIRNIFENINKCKTNGYVISNGVHSRFISKNIKKPKELNDKFLILFTGRFSKEKSHKILIKAASKSKYKDKIQLIFAGQGPLHDRLIYESKKYKINIPIMKFFSKDELVDVINYCDLYCHPAEVEIEAIACLEAISCGLVPIIANSKKCATKSFALDEMNLFKCNDYNDLAKKIDYWIINENERIKRKEEYLNYSKIFNQDLCMEKMRNMLKEISDKYHA